nr:hypothetical protein [Tanacetum cinerariifolium]
MVLQDEEENKIVATVKESICPKFEKCLEEGKCFYISTFFVRDNQRTPKIVENKNKIHFYKATDVTPCDTSSGLVHGIRFKSFDTLLQEDNQSNVSYDLIGDLISCSMIDQVMVDGNRRPFIRLELEDLTLIENRSHEGDDHCVTHLTTFSSYSIKNDFLNNLPKVCINDIRDIGKACGQDTDVEYKYKIPLRVMDSTGSVSLTLFDRQAHQIIDKSAAELLQEDKHTYSISQLTNVTDIINEQIKRESDDK